MVNLSSTARAYYYCPSGNGPVETGDAEMSFDPVQ